jgi:germination protein M
VRTFGILLLAALIAVGGYIVWHNRMLEKEAERLRAQLAAQESEITVFLVKHTPVDFVLTPVTRKISGPATPQKALELLIEGPRPGEDLHPAVSPRTQVESLTITEGTALVSFSKALQEDYIGGAQNEANLVTAIVHTLIQFPEIERVQILIAGEVVETIGGHMAIDRPLSGM